VTSFQEKFACCLKENDCPNDLFDSIKFELEMDTLIVIFSDFKRSEEYKKMLDEERSTHGCCQLF
jgi:hypothetical protein